MSIKLSRQVWETSSQRGTPLILLLALADHANDDGWAWPSIPTLAKKSRMSERYVQIMLKDIENSGEISIQNGQGPNGVNRYHIHPGIYRSWTSKKMNHPSLPTEVDPVSGDSSPDELPITGEVNPDALDGESQFTGEVSPDVCDDTSEFTAGVNPGALDGPLECTAGVNPNAPKRPWNPQGTIIEPPPPTPNVNSGPFDSTWDPGEAAEAAYYDKQDDDFNNGDSEDDDWGDGGEKNHDWEDIPVSVLPLIKRAKFDQLVDTGGT